METASDKLSDEGVICGQGWGNSEEGFGPAERLRCPRPLEGFMGVGVALYLPGNYLMDH